jgi:transposase InsO family protein
MANSATSASISTGSRTWTTRATIAAWRDDYNSVRPHSALGNLTPLDFAERLRHPEVLSA